ncbi:tetratricopeptide repeat protein [Acidithiobacillus sp. M4-SHS-6]|uniref:tetratricopeptide repeat protein n=1 Tax=Acidithiobacillus sp. M4-SHS-6 TaxID=3383024 RepID=UPI0039BE8F4E
MRSKLGGMVAGLLLGLIAGNALADTSSAGMTGEQLYYLLVAEFATLQQEPKLAIPAWNEAAKLAPEANVLERATQVTARFGDFDDALKLVKHWRELAPNSAKADQFEAALLLTKGQEQQAIQLLQATLARFPDDPKITLQLSELLMAHGQSGEARRLLTALADKDPHSASAFYTLGRIDLIENKAAHAIPWLEKALSLRPDWQEAAIHLAEALQATQGPTVALHSIQSFTASHPDAILARQYLAALYLKMGGMTQAYRLYQQMARQDPENPGIALSLGIMEMERQHWHAAESQLQRARNLAPQSPAPIYYLGRLYEAQGHWAEALQWYQRIHSGPLYPEVELRSARVEYLLGDHQKALNHLQKLATAHPDEVQIPLLQADLLQNSGQLQQALQILQQALERLPDNAELWYAQGAVQEQLGDYPAMEKSMHQVIQLAPDNAQAYNFLGYSLVERNQDLSEASKLLHKAISLEPDNPEILDSIGWLHHRQGDNQKALEYLQKAHQALPDDPELSRHLGRILWALGKYQEARDVWQQALDKNPNDTALRQELTRQP